MSVKTINIPIDLLIEMLKQLNDEDKNEIFEKAFIDVDTEPLTSSEKKSIAVAQKEFEKGETIQWSNGE